MPKRKFISFRRRIIELAQEACPGLWKVQSAPNDSDDDD